MSLINDALKRAKEAQQQTPTAASGPSLTPTEPAPAPNAGSSKMLFYILIACVVIGNLFLFIYASNRDGKKSEPAHVAARELPATTVVSTPSPAVLPAPAPVVATAPPVEAGPVVVVTTATNAPVAEPAAVVAPPEPPKPAPLKLQSIIMNPTRPSAMISGKFLFVGDRVQGFRVTAIDQETVTLVGNGQTNVLELP
jgi:hypothetical protein